MVTGVDRRNSCLLDETKQRKLQLHVSIPLEYGVSEVESAHFEWPSRPRHGSFTLKFHPQVFIPIDGCRLSVPHQPSAVSNPVPSCSRPMPSTNETPSSTTPPPTVEHQFNSVRFDKHGQNKETALTMSHSLR
ncbi:hypothetical protein EVAR_60372_1 [Eumeta japonica]|uniref:Uncharacterized protein n=1 Tax=Eumeta variegata TaxID=151549 RepID=A0A4C1ZPL0_EUMVA|nr:hypothetical protein EVAR_60372_1 [Eumeta japonica]